MTAWSRGCTVAVTTGTGGRGIFVAARLTPRHSEIQENQACEDHNRNPYSLHPAHRISLDMPQD